MHFEPLAGALSILLSVYIWLNLGPILAYQFTKVNMEDEVVKAYLVANIPFFAMAFGLYLSLRFLMRAIQSRLFRKGKLVTTNKSIFWVSLFTALLFTLPHLSNQEMLHFSNKGAVIFYYALFGFGGTFWDVVQLALGLGAVGLVLNRMKTFKK
ncbi:MAG: hypothetical protein RBR15_12485 [Sphaerochaeta sp.]|nr:hypothetical protein [Sphaerochaeta sp.]